MADPLFPPQFPAFQHTPKSIGVIELSTVEGAFQFLDIAGENTIRECSCLLRHRFMIFLHAALMYDSLITDENPLLECRTYYHIDEFNSFSSHGILRTRQIHAGLEEIEFVDVFSELFKRKRDN